MPEEINSKPQFKPIISRVKLNQEQAVLVCCCYSNGQRWQTNGEWYVETAVVSATAACYRSGAAAPCVNQKLLLCGIISPVPALGHNALLNDSAIS